MGNIKLYLRANERIFINGAVLRVDRKVSIELLNDTTFLLENHIMQKEDANTPLKQLYFVVQLLLMDPVNTDPSRRMFRDMVSDILETLENVDMKEGIKEVDIEVSTGKIFSALKMIRKLFPAEQLVLESGSSMPDNIAYSNESASTDKGAKSYVIR